MFISTVSRRGQPVGRSILTEEVQRHVSHFSPFAGLHLCARQSAITHTCIYTPFSRTLLSVESSVIVSTSIFPHRKMPTDFVCVVRVCAHVLCVYLSQGRCPPTWPVTGQSLRTLPYCTPRGLETGHQRLKEDEEEFRRGQEAERAGEREEEGRERRRGTDEV